MAFADDTKYFIGSWYWTRTGTIDKTDVKIFTQNGLFETLVNTTFNKSLECKFIVDSTNKRIAFFNVEGTAYIYLYEFSNNFQIITLHDLTIQENPVTYCYKEKM
jgi:hypothetical protein